MHKLLARELLLTHLLLITDKTEWGPVMQANLPTTFYSRHNRAYIRVNDSLNFATLFAFGERTVEKWEKLFGVTQAASGLPR